MKFEHVVTIAALVIGPAGIWFGWWLSERASVRREASAAKAAEAGAEQGRALEVARVARRLSGAARSLAGGAYLKYTARVTPEGFSEAIEEFNEIRVTYRRVLLEARVLGPSWVVAPGEEIETRGQSLTQLIMRLNDSVQNRDILTANAEIPRMDAAVDALVAVLSARYNPAHLELPERPDLDAVG